MISVQVLESIPYNSNSYPQKMTSHELALLWLNGQIWKIKNPEIPLVLFTDSDYLNFFESYNILDTWSSINTDILNKDIDIEKTIFWSNSKFRVYKEINEPLLFMDCDLLVWGSINDWNILNYDLVTSYREELTLSCYLNPETFISEYPVNLISNWYEMPLNASLIYFGNQQIKNRYTKIALEWMKGCSINNKNLNKYSVYFIEQRLLAEIAKLEKANQITLLKNYNTDKGWNNTNLVDGLWSWEESFNHVFHIGYDKVCLRKGTKTYNDEYIKFFIDYIEKNCIEKGFEHLLPRFLELAFLY